MYLYIQSEHEGKTKDKKRHALKTSAYDPLGFAAPVILQWRILHLCEENLQWDEIVPQPLQDNWEEWKRNR